MSGSISLDPLDPGDCPNQTSMDSASHSSGESVYHSCSENSAWDSDQDDEQHYISASSCYLGSTNATPLSSDSETLRLLVCLNAARILLAEVTNSARKVGSLRPFKGEAILKRILAIGTEWKRTTDEEFGSIVMLPIFQSSLGLLRSERRFCSQVNIGGFIAQLRDESSLAIVMGQNDALTIVGISSESGGKPSSYIVFNPQCRASTDLGGASLRFFPTVEETVQHVYNITAIHRGGESKAPRHMYSGYILVPPGDASSPRHGIVSQYQANILLLQETLELRDARAREFSLGAEISGLQTRTELELQGKRDTFSRRDGILAEIVALKLDLDDVHTFTAAILNIPPSPGSTAVDIEADPEEVGQVVGSGEATTSKQESLSDDTSPTASRRSEVSTPPTSPETLWNAPAKGYLSQKAKNQAREEGEERTREAQNLQAQKVEQAASLSLAHQLVEEDEGELANGSLGCSRCLDKWHKSFMVSMEGCDHVTCRTCIQEYVGGQVGGEVLQGPISCPVCTEE